MRRPSGFTLIEILIAMAVFLIGMVSVLAVFPVGIRSSTISTDQSVATALAESLTDALTLALRQYDGSATSNVVFYHDGLGPSGRDSFAIPAIETWVSGTTVYTANGRSRPYWYPFDPTATTNTAAGSVTATVLNPPATLASITSLKGGKVGTLVGPASGLNTKDFSDPLGQYSFRFMCHEYKNPNDFDSPDEDPLSWVSVIAGDPTGRQFMYENGAQA